MPTYTGQTIIFSLVVFIIFIVRFLVSKGNDVSGASVVKVRHTERSLNTTTPPITHSSTTTSHTTINKLLLKPHTNTDHLDHKKPLQNNFNLTLQPENNKNWLILGFTDVKYLSVASIWHKQMEDLGYDNHALAFLRVVHAFLGVFFERGKEMSQRMQKCVRKNFLRIFFQKKKQK